jgi:hypothetical protein
MPDSRTEVKEEIKMDHKHMGPLDYACPLCFVEADKKAKAKETNARRDRRNNILGLLLLIGGVIGGMVALSKYLG